jgi:hypothetical protein
MITKTLAPFSGVKLFAIIENTLPCPSCRAVLLWSGGTAYTENAEDRWMPSLATAEGSGSAPDIPRR